MLRHFRLGLLTLALLSPGDARAAGARIKDLVMVSGARDNQLVGYGLVTGLAEDGDKNPIYTIQTIANILQRHGISLSSTTLSSKNVAAVMITADIPAFIKPGTRLDVTVSSLGDAKSLSGGVLLQTPLLGADGKVYAAAQGPVMIGGFSSGTSGAGGANVQKNHPNVGQIPGGALVEKEIPATVVQENHLELLLRKPDFTSASRLAAAINEKFTNSAQAVDFHHRAGAGARGAHRRSGGFHRPPRGDRGHAGYAGAHRDQRANRDHRRQCPDQNLQLRRFARQPDDQHRVHHQCLATQRLQLHGQDGCRATDGHECYRGERISGSAARNAHHRESGFDPEYLGSDAA